MAFEELNRLIQRQNKLAKAQPCGPRLLALHTEVIDKWADIIDGETVIDVGCGRGVAREVWESHGFTWYGAVIGEDYFLDPYVFYADMHYIPGNYDVIYARHILEHSPVPALALENWHDHTKWCIVVVPAKIGAIKPAGHISVLSREVWEEYFRFTGFMIADYEYAKTRNPPGLPQNDEYRWLLHAG